MPGYSPGRLRHHCASSPPLAFKRIPRGPSPSKSCGAMIGGDADRRRGLEVSAKPALAYKPLLGSLSPSLSSFSLAPFLPVTEQ